MFHSFKCFVEFLRLGLAVTCLTFSFIAQAKELRVQANTKPPIDFNRDLRPIFSENCYACHGPDKNKRKAGLRLDREEETFSKLESGDFAIVRGDTEKSKLLELVASDDEDDRMPPKKTGKRLTKTQIDLLRRWIEQGAAWKRHWAYIPPERPPLPEVKNKKWPRNEIDYLILARLEKEEISPSQEADRSPLLRRLSFDLTGLPPTVSEVDAFLRDKSSQAYEKTVDRLLASPHYGERMAQQWLDLARYADSDGYHRDSPRSMWQYRDWVINAFNQNKPFDQFTVEQIAGDLLPGTTLDQRIATAFNRNGMSTTESGADPEEYLNKHVTDRVNTTSTVWLGSTIGCAECHDHKYDPFSQKEYYQLYDFFNQIPEEGLDVDPAPPFVEVPNAEQRAAMAKVDAELAQIDAQRKALLAATDPAWPAAQAEWAHRVLANEKVNPPVLLSDWSSIGPFTAASGSEAYAKAFPPEQEMDLAKTYEDGKLKWVPQPSWQDSAVQTLSGENAATYLYRTITVEAAKTVALYMGSGDALKGWLNGKAIIAKDIRREAAPNQDEVEVELKRGENKLLLKIINYDGTYGFYFSTDRESGDEKFTAIKKILKLSATERKPEQMAEVEQYFRENHLPEVQQFNQRLRELKKSKKDLKASIPTVRVMQEMAERRPTRIRIRGDYRNKGEQVTANVPRVLAPLPADSKTNRLTLANWLVNPNNPLVARVTVNRYWALYFGTGLVKTGNDFGSQGELPSHPELLDWLAREFIDSGWNIKALQKKIVMSATYRQSSKTRKELLARDPANRLLARGARFRLPAEMIRDGVLAYSGLYDCTLGGPSVRPYQPAGLWEEILYKGVEKYEVSHGVDLYRRSLYTLWKRSMPYPMFKTFDAPDRTVSTEQRSITCTPLQAFVTMNEDTFVEAARVFAQRIMREGGDSLPSHLAYAYKVALARLPTLKEQKILSDIYEEMLNTYQQDLTSAVELISAGESKRPQQINELKLAAWTAVAQVILNLDETVTKQ